MRNHTLTHKGLYLVRYSFRKCWYMLNDGVVTGFYFYCASAVEIETLNANVTDPLSIIQIFKSLAKNNLQTQRASENLCPTAMSHAFQ